MDDETLFEKLLHLDDEVAVEDLLTHIGYGLDNESVWQPLGGMENNFSTVGNQQTDATAALVEKIINGIDATLMAECFTHDIDPEGPRAPTTMSHAVEMFFKVKNGQIGDLDSDTQGTLAENIHLVAVGEKKTPCYLIIDRGEGQTPDAFPDTFLSLNRSNKLRIGFVQGKFNSGGTGVLQFCGNGERNMQLIVSRRHPKAPVKPGDESRSLWGFTLVRRLKASAGRRNSMYVYLAPGGKVPRFAADAIKVLPQERRSIQPAPYAVALPYGTCVKLYNFRWRGKSSATLEARYELERFLHAPCLPFRVTETRDYKAHYFSTTVAGVWAAIATSIAKGKPNVEPGFPAYADLDLPGIGHLPYSIAVFREDIDHTHVPQGVHFTINGQVHGGLPVDFVTRSLKFDELSKHLLVSVDCTGMDSSVREDFFLASRDRVRRNEVYDEIVSQLKDELREHRGLKELNAARRKKAIEDAVGDENASPDVFNAILKADPMLSALFGTGDRLVTSTGPGPAAPFVGKKFPTYFRLAKDPRGGLVKHCPINLSCRVEIETDAVNDYFKRTDSPGSLSTSPQNVIERSNLWNGKFTACLRVPWNAKPGDRFDVKIEVEDVTRKEPFVCSLTLVADKEADPRPSGQGGNRTQQRNPQGATKQTAVALAVPLVVDKPDPDPLASLRVKHNPNGGFDFFVNPDNTYLLTELTRAKDEHRPLIKYWFKFGLAICALGLLQQEKQYEEKMPSDRDVEASAAKNNASEGENLERINACCDGVARVIIPIIRILYGGPKIPSP